MTLPGEIATERAEQVGSGVSLRVLATTDLHAHLLPFDYFTDRHAPGTGLARLGTLIAAARAASRNCLLFDNGDTLQGAPLADAAVAEIVPAGRTHPMIAAMNAMGFDAATIGNHEFDFGLPYLEASLSGAQFPIVLANANRIDGTSFLPPRHILARVMTDAEGAPHPIRIGVTGAVPPQVADWNRLYVQDQILFEDMLPAIHRQVCALKDEGADIVIVLAHSGQGAKTLVDHPENAALLVAEIPDVDAVIAGHTHRVLPDAPPARVHGVPIVQPGALGSHLGCIDLELQPPLQSDREPQWRVCGARAGTFPVSQSPKNGSKRSHRLLPDFPEVRSLIAREHRVTRAYVARPLGHSATPLETYFSTLAPCRATQLISDAQCAASAPLIAADPALRDLPVLSAVAPFKAGGRAGSTNYTDIPAGALKLRHAADLYIYPNVLSVLRITGRGLRDWLERAASLFNRIDPGKGAPQLLVDHAFAPYNFDRLIGLTYAVDVSQPPRTNADGDEIYDTPGRIRDLSFADGRPVQDDDTALVVTNSYRAAGGGHMQAAAEADTVLTSTTPIRESLARFVTEAPGPLDVTPQATWWLHPLGGVPVIFETGAGAARHNDRLADLGLRPANRPASQPGFASFLMNL
ncbi:bifunctional 2',3'-cyclic-nucleotide 2'-phosphodiesterase/3'-nucleotidase [Gymnodinialimonas sp. 2305UL16-5]|uniref:bifunctional 2',3'-cyclic-nucleotide 2'-phosphodiesterase/3'-nucleotidase n=1 Tax=Gymnodinialimonas mytili TaxID=3126503 RepID=UPI0030B39C07